MRSIGGSIRNFAPFVVILGYIGMYYTGTKGIGQLLPDLQSISVDRLMAHYQNLLIAAAAGFAIYMLKHVKIPSALKDILLIVLWALIGYQIALAVDPPLAITYTGAVRYVPPAQYNPYAYGGGA